MSEVLYIIRTHNAPVHESFVVKATSFSEAEKKFKNRFPYEFIDSIEIIHNSYDRIMVIE